MPGIRGAGFLVLLAALVVGLFAEDPIGEFSPMEAAGLLSLGGLSLLMAASIVEGFSRHWTYGVQAVAATTSPSGMTTVRPTAMSPMARSITVCSSPREA